MSISMALRAISRQQSIPDATSHRHICARSLLPATAPTKQSTAWRPARIYAAKIPHAAAESFSRYFKFLTRPLLSFEKIIIEMIDF